MTTHSTHRSPGRPGRPGRPIGALGECGRAFLAEAQRQPGTVRQIAERSLVGVPVATQLAKRLLADGTLQRLSSGKPAVLAAAPPDDHSSRHGPGNVFLVLSLSAWR